MASQTIAAFSPNDFFYVKAEENDNRPLDCSNYPDITAESCNKGDLDLKCQLCLNKNYANTLYSIQNENGGTDQRYEDVKTVYNDELFNSFNLGIGIIIATGFIYTKYIYIKQ